MIFSFRVCYRIAVGNIGFSIWPDTPAVGKCDVDFAITKIVGLCAGKVCITVKSSVIEIESLTVTVASRRSKATERAAAVK
jgi:hypothetical protein